MLFSVDAVIFQIADRVIIHCTFVMPCQVSSPTCSSYYIHPVHYNVLGSTANKEINPEPLYWIDTLFYQGSHYLLRNIIVQDGAGGTPQ